VTTHSQLFSARIYPRSAVEGAASAFQGVCQVRLDNDPVGTRATLELPDGAGEDVVGEFCNLVLAAAIETRLGSAT
jgi:hypothetical protein